MTGSSDRNAPAVSRDVPGGDKPRLAIYWAASCGGCEIAVLNIHEKILAVDEAFSLCFCPCLMDAKRADVEAMADGGIALTLMNGAIRTEENAEMAVLLRRKSQILVAFGSCAHEGCIPALANLADGNTFFERIFQGHGEPADDAAGALPGAYGPGNDGTVSCPEGTLHLPPLRPRVSPLSAIVPVDYIVPGCPPEPHQIWSVLDAVISGAELPPRGSVLGAGDSAVCRECPRTRSDRKLSRLYRTYEIETDPELCLLDQGVVCMGIATRSGCGALCPGANMPCTGCYGPPPGVRDQGAAMAGALGSLLDTGEPADKNDEERAARVREILRAVPDAAGTFYKYSLAGSLLGGRRG